MDGNSFDGEKLSQQKLAIKWPFHYPVANTGSEKQNLSVGIFVAYLNCPNSLFRFWLNALKLRGKGSRGDVIRIQTLILWRRKPCDGCFVTDVKCITLHQFHRTFHYIILMKGDRSGVLVTMVSQELVSGGAVHPSAMHKRTDKLNSAVCQGSHITYGLWEHWNCPSQSAMGKKKKKKVINIDLICVWLR